MTKKEVWFEYVYHPAGEAGAKANRNAVMRLEAAPNRMVDARVSRAESARQRVQAVANTDAWKLPLQKLFKAFQEAAVKWNCDLCGGTLTRLEEG